MKPESTEVLTLFSNERKKRKNNHRTCISNYLETEFFLILSLSILQLPAKQHKECSDVRFVFFSVQTELPCICHQRGPFVSWHEENHKPVLQLITSDHGLGLHYLIGTQRQQG